MPLNISVAAGRPQHVTPLAKSAPAARMTAPETKWLAHDKFRRIHSSLGLCAGQKHRSISIQDLAKQKAGCPTAVHTGNSATDTSFTRELFLLSWDARSTSQRPRCMIVRKQIFNRVGTRTFLPHRICGASGGQ